MAGIVITVLAVLMAAAAAENARADSHVITLVKNTHLQRDDIVSAGNSSNGSIGQRFTTGSNTDGYNLTSVGIRIFRVLFSGSETVTARIHEFNDSATNDLGSLVATLTTPATLTDGVNFFDAPAHVNLEPDTEYILNFHATGDDPDDLWIASIFSDAQTGATG